MIGNHRDAWVYGAVDPGSGTAATLEMCRALGAAVKNGWKPRRTLVYASWDAEEYGLVGSTEWAEEHAKEIDEKAVLLLNVDSAVSGPRARPRRRPLAPRPGARRRRRRSPTSARAGTLRAALDREAAAQPGPPARPLDLADPLWDEPDDRRRRPRRGPPASSRRSCNPLGSGSDYTAFLDHLGVPVARRRLQRAVRRLSLDLRQLQLDGEVRRPRVPHPRHGRPALHGDRDAGRGGRRRAAQVRPLRRGAPRVRRRPAADRRAPGRGRPTPEQSRPPIAFDGPAGLVKAVRAFQAQAAALDRATDDARRPRRRRRRRGSPG